MVLSSQTTFVYQRLFISMLARKVFPSAAPCSSPLQVGSRDTVQVFGQEWRGDERPWGLLGTLLAWVKGGE